MTFIQIYASGCTFWVFIAVHYTSVVYTAVHYSTVWTELNSSPTFCCYEQDPCTHPLSVSQCSPVFLSCICLGVQLMSFRAEYVLDYMMLNCFPKWLYEFTLAPRYICVRPLLQNSLRINASRYLYDSYVSTWWGCYFLNSVPQKSHLSNMSNLPPTSVTLHLLCLWHRISRMH